MIVWLASFPRSGNTFLRMLLHRSYGVRTSTVYEFDGVADRLGADLIGATAPPASYEAMRAAPELYFVKTHRQKDAQVQPGDRAICLVRDGRDALVSWARLNSETDPGQFDTQLRTMIERREGAGTGGWGANVLSWRAEPEPRHVLVRYEDLICDSHAEVARAMEQLAAHLPAVRRVTVPDFSSLHAIDGGFFRHGRPGSHREEMTGALQDLFWAHPENVEAMRLLEYS